jgi:hypothetical protein
MRYGFGIGSNVCVPNPGPLSQFGSALEFDLDPDAVVLSSAGFADGSAFNTATWSKNRVDVTPDQIAAPAELGGTVIADRLADTAVAGVHTVVAGATNFVAGVQATYRGYLRADTLTHCAVTVGGVTLWLDVSGASFDAAPGGGVTATLISLDNGWVRLDATNPNPTNEFVQINLTETTFNTSYAGTGKSLFACGFSISQTRAQTAVDQSGKGRNASEATAANQFEWRPGALNGRASLYARAAGKRLGTGAFGATIAQPGTIIVVASPEPATQTATRPFCDGIAGTNRWNPATTTSALAGFPAGDSAVFVHAGTGTPGYVVPAGQLTLPRAFRFEVNGATSKVFQNAEAGARVTGNAGAHTLTGLWIGADNTGAGTFLGALYRVFVVSRLFTAADVAWYNTWLNRQFGIT